MFYIIIIIILEPIEKNKKKPSVWVLENVLIKTTINTQKVPT